jgi:peptidoglycan/LPS O-acetylase OafA/YrhL
MDFAAIVTVAILLPICLATKKLQISEDHTAIRVIRILASATFPLYLIHVPLFLLLSAVIPYPHASFWSKLFLLVSAVALSLLLANPCTQLKNYLRSALLRKKLRIVRDIDGVDAPQSPGYSVGIHSIQAFFKLRNW